MSDTMGEVPRRFNRAALDGTSALLPERQPSTPPSARRGRRHLVLVPGGAGAPPRPRLPCYSDVVSRPAGRSSSARRGVAGDDAPASSSPPHDTLAGGELDVGIGEGRPGGARGRAYLSPTGYLIAIGTAAIGFTALVLSGGSYGDASTDSPLSIGSSAVGWSAAASAQAGSAADVTDGQGMDRQRIVTVRPGETLWQIASVVEPHRHAGDVVAEIQQANGLASAGLQPGQVLVIP